MNSRAIKILRELLASDQPITSDYLAHILDVTSRTVRDDIKALNHSLHMHGAKIKSTRGTGYELLINDDQNFRHYLNQSLNHVSQEQALLDSPDARIRYLVKRFLLAERYLKLDDLCDEMHISKSTIQSDLRSVKKMLEKHDIYLDKKPNYGLKAIGNEVKLRFAMSEYIFDRSETGSKTIWRDQLSTIADADKEQLDKVWSVIINQIKENHISLADIAINNLYIHIAIAYKRIKSGHQVSLINQEFDEITKQKEYRVAHHIVRAAEEIFMVKFPPEEIAYIAIHLLGTKMVSQTNMSEAELENIMEKQIQIMTTKILDALEAKMHLGIRHDKELLIGLGLHLKPAINRYKYGMNVRNPMLQDIKLNYPLAFEAGIIAGIVLEQEMDVSIDENEIGYIALHIGAAIERKKMQSSPMCCYIVCASGLGSAHLIKYKLKAVFGSRIEVMGTTEYYKLKQIPFDKTDFIVSSVPINEDLPVPVIDVNAILSDKDIAKIEAFVEEDIDHVFEYIQEDLLFLNKDLQTQDEVLAFLVDQISKTTKLPDDYLKRIYEREEIAPTAYGNLIAIPHPITAQTNDTFLTICTLKKPIDWADKRVQFVCLLNVEKDSKEDLQHMYEMLGKMVDNPSLIQQLVQCKNYRDFINTLLAQN
ncbi:BglG family transcription antiterminator [Amphibacillus jilinensis]|uniref:BglG family transcription antiterminator n=1 Tax=Amphibacillus jilinensis TaxID=1216008 RepID=UPI0002FA23B3|nr:BglG family transcription antiterminator [Amphibacillus jilinensis]